MTHFLTRPEVLGLTRVSRATIDRWERDGLFPRRRQLGPRRVAWDSAEVAAWAASRPAVGAPDAGGAS